MKSAEKQDPLTGKIIDAALEVHRILGPDLLDSLYYREAFCLELAERDLPYERQKAFQVDYKGKYVGNLSADIVVDKRVLVEVKAVSQLAPLHRAQSLTYLKIMKLNLGLLINFNARVLEDSGIERIVI